MTPQEGMFFDICGYRPQSPWMDRAANGMVLVLAGLLLVAGWLFKDFMEHQLRYLSLGENEIAIPYPAHWLLQVDPSFALYVVRPTGSSAYPAREKVLIQPLPQGTVSDFWLQQRQQLNNFRLREQKTVTLANGREAYLLEYVIITDSEDPDLTPWVSVHAMDLVFPAMYGGEERLVAVTLASELHEWSEVEPTFHRILTAMGVNSLVISDQ